MAAASDDIVWALFDSGSGLTTCPADRFGDVVLESCGPHGAIEAATGDPVKPLGRRCVHLAAENGDGWTVDFTVTNVNKVIVAADALLQHGYVAVLDRFRPRLVHEAFGEISLHRSGRTFWLRLLRGGGGDTGLVVAPVSRASPPAARAVATSGGGAAEAGGRQDGGLQPQPLAETPAEAERRGEDEAAPGDWDETAAIVQDGGFLRISEEAAGARARGIPVMPPLEARQLHRLTHWPYRAWCVWCVRGRGREEAHFRKRRSSDIPVVGLDYCFPALGVESGSSLTVLVITEIYSGAVEATVVDEKGPATYPINVVTGAMDAWGLRRAGVLTDQEPSIMALAAAVKAARAHDTLVYSGPRYDSKSKGRIEVMCGLIEGLLRTMLMALAFHYNLKLHTGLPIIGWVVRHAAWVLTRYAVKENGLTPFRMLRGRDYNGSIAEIGEVVLFKFAGVVPKMAAQWGDGVWLGKRATSDEHLLGTAAGVVHARSVQRRPEAERWSAEVFGKLAVHPWSPKVLARPAAVNRQRYLTQAILDRLGRSPGCAACGGAARPHTPACRERLEGLLAEEEQRALGSHAPSGEPAAEAMDLPKGLGGDAVPEMSADGSAPMETGAAQEEPEREAELFSDIVADDASLRSGATSDISSSGGTSDMPPSRGTSDMSSGGARPPEAKRHKTVGGLAVNVRISAVCVASVVYGALSGEPLCPELLAQGRRRERELMNQFGVYERVLLKDARGKRVRSKWVDDYKGKGAERIVRSRLVAMEFALDARYDTYAGTPALKAVRLGLALACSFGVAWLACVYDVSVAFYHAALDEDIHIIPPRGEEEEGYVWQLRRALYGTRRASFLFQQFVAEVLSAAGFIRPGVACQVFWHTARRIYVVIHGDDFLAICRGPDADWLDGVLAEKMLVKRGPRVGSARHGGDPEGEFLKRRVAWTSEGFTWEADRAHAMTVITGCAAGRALTPSARRLSPGSKTVGRSHRDAEEELEGNAIYEFRRLAATALYLAGDRPEIQAAVAHIARGMAKPLRLHWLHLCRLASFLRSSPRLVWEFKYQAFPTAVTAEVDADWAGNPDTRRSTDGGYEFFGAALLDGWCATQHTVALSSGESELYGLCNGASRVLWTRALLQECGFNLAVEIYTDSSAAKGVTARLGAGRVRHLEARFLWVQEKVRDRTLIVKKLKGEINRADLQTKLLEPGRFWELFQRLPFSTPPLLTGRSGGDEIGEAKENVSGKIMDEMGDTIYEVTAITLY